ncbi:MAG TPA: monovalent cation/H(+) antiporter subunit G [Anaerolineales bacterium]|nr:monovalent cation/H(+) antiporter subunit G [Anaerolineales bacterium]
MMGIWLPWLIDGLVLLSLLIMTVVIFGLFRMPDIYTQLHAASKAVVLGVIAMLLSIALLADTTITVRAILIGGFILLTTPVSAHAIGRAAYLQREPMRGPDSLDETGRLTHGGSDAEELD